MFLDLKLEIWFVLNGLFQNIESKLFIDFVQIFLLANLFHLPTFNNIIDCFERCITFVQSWGYVGWLYLKSQAF